MENKAAPTSGEESPRPNRRRFFRQPLTLAAFARRLTSVDDAPRFRSGPQVFPLVRPQGLGSERLLRQIDDKLDALLGSQALDIVRHDFPLHLEVVELSASGLRCRDDGGLKIGDPVEVVLRLSSYPPQLVGLVARVLRRDGELAVLDFTQIRSADEDRLVRALLDEQRRLRREQGAQESEGA